MLRYTRNKLKTLIKKAKRSFMITVSSSKRPKKVWRAIHLSASTVESVTASSPALSKDQLIDRLTDDSHSSFLFCNVTYQEVLREIMALRSDCWTEPDNIPLSLSNWWPSIWSLRSRISSTHALTETNIPCCGKLRALVRFLRWMSHGQMTITDLSLFHLYFLRL